MNQVVGTKVPITISNVSRCQCPGCPVQVKSACVSGKMGKLTEAIRAKELNAADIPGVYCSSGKAACTDLRTSQSCMCGTCAVFEEYKLAVGASVGYYCKSGSAQ